MSRGTFMHAELNELLRVVDCYSRCNYKLNVSLTHKYKCLQFCSWLPHCYRASILDFAFDRRPSLCVTFSSHNLATVFLLLETNIRLPDPNPNKVTALSVSTASKISSFETACFTQQHHFTMWRVYLTRSWALKLFEFSDRVRTWTALFKYII